MFGLTYNSTQGTNTGNGGFFSRITDFLSGADNVLRTSADITQNLQRTINPRFSMPTLNNVNPQDNPTFSGQRTDTTGSPIVAKEDMTKYLVMGGIALVAVVLLVK